MVDVLVASEELREIKERIKTKKELVDEYNSQFKAMKKFIKECEIFQKNTDELSRGFLFLLWETYDKGQKTFSTQYTRHLLGKVQEAKSGSAE